MERDVEGRVVVRTQRRLHHVEHKGGRRRRLAAIGGRARVWVGGRCVTWRVSLGENCEGIDDDE